MSNRTEITGTMTKNDIISLQELLEGLHTYPKTVQNEVRDMLADEKPIREFSENIHKAYESGEIKVNPKTGDIYANSLKKVVNTCREEITLRGGVSQISTLFTPYELSFGSQFKVNLSKLAKEGMSEELSELLMESITNLVKDALIKAQRQYYVTNDPKYKMITRIKEFSRKSDIWIGNDIENYGEEVPLEVVQGVYDRLPELEEAYNKVTSIAQDIVNTTGSHKMTEEAFS